MDKKNVNVAPPGEISPDSHGYVNICDKSENYFVSINEPSKIVAEFANVCKHLLYMQ